MSMPAAQAIEGVLEAAIYVDDLDAATGFYRDTLGLEEIVRHDPRHVFFRCGSTVVLAFNPAETRQPPAPDAALPAPPHGAEGDGHICFTVEEPELGRLRDALAASGIAIEADFRWPNGARSVYVRDPAGNSVEFGEKRLWEPGA